MNGTQAARAPGSMSEPSPARAAVRMRPTGDREVSRVSSSSPDACRLAKRFTVSGEEHGDGPVERVGCASRQSGCDRACVGRGTQIPRERVQGRGARLAMARASRAWALTRTVISLRMIPTGEHHRERQDVARIGDGRTCSVEERRKKS